MVPKTYPESFRVIVGGDRFSSLIFRAGNCKSCAQYNYTTALTFDQQYFRLRAIFFHSVISSWKLASPPPGPLNDYYLSSFSFKELVVMLCFHLLLSEFFSFIEMVVMLCFHLLLSEFFSFIEMVVMLCFHLLLFEFLQLFRNGANVMFSLIII